MREWHIGLDPWIIQDGNYEDFRCGEIVDFALEFYPESLRVTTDERSEANRVTDCKYRVGAEVVLSTGKVLVIDFGVRAYREGSLRFRPGSFVEGEIQVGIDPFMYFEWLSKSPRIPPLIYRWRIEQIQKLSAPLIEGKGPDGLRALVRDESQRIVENVQRTAAWGDEPPATVPRQSAFSYILVCPRLDEAPRRRGRVSNPE